MMQNFINGITGGAARLWNAVTGVAGQIASVFQHSTPAQGPLAGDDMWMSHMIKSFEDQLTNGIPIIARASVSVGSAIQSGIVGQQSSAGVASTYSSAYTTTYGATANTLHVYAQNDTHIERVVRSVLADTNRQGNYMLRRAGGFANFGGIG